MFILFIFYLDDPYDIHVFGGYNGEETKHGYKNEQLQLNKRSIRRLKRKSLLPTSFSIDQISNSLRFDGFYLNKKLFYSIIFRKSATSNFIC